MAAVRNPLLVVLLIPACGEVGTRKLPDAPTIDSVVEDAAPDAPPDAPPDAAPVACTYISATSSDTSIASYTAVGATLESFGCAPIDPTFWLSGTGMSVTVTFVTPQARPALRIWGMNTDDTATVMVNGVAYALDATTASIAPKVTCGLSPGPDGVAFVAGSVTGANTPGQGNFSYNDVTVEQASVTSIQITGTGGAGWGVAGATAGDCTVLAAGTPAITPAGTDSDRVVR
jgi:hypothetical protein